MAIQLMSRFWWYLQFSSTVHTLRDVQQCHLTVRHIHAFRPKKEAQLILEHESILWGEGDSRSLKGAFT